jgi:outer membrane protein insertion porin family
MLLAVALATPSAWSQANVIAEIRVEGVQFVSQDGVLGKISEHLKVGDPFDPDSPEDQAKLQEAQRAVVDLGFFESVVPATQRGDEGVTITFAVVEKQRIQRIQFVGNTIFTDDELLDVIVSRPDQIIDDGTIRRDARHIEEYYDDHRRMAKVVEAGRDRFGVVSFVISEAVIEDIVIEGLKKTKLVVVKRKIKSKPGDVYDGDAIQEDMHAIYNLDLFEDVNVDFRQGVKDPERGIIVVFIVKEKRTGTLTAGVGYSSIENFVGVVSAQETNFRGRGERISASIQFGGRESYELGFFEPSLDRAGTSFEVNIFDTERRRQFLPGGSFTTARREFDERRKGFNVTVARPLSGDLSASVRVRQESISDPFFQVSRVLPTGVGGIGTLQTYPPGFGGRRQRIPRPPSNPDLEPDRPEPGDTLMPLTVFAPLAEEDLSTITLGAIMDTRDIIMNPTRGGFGSLYLEQAGIFGGDSDFTKISLDLRRYIKVNPRKHVVAVRLLAGTTLGDVPLVESYSVGGGYTLRGYTEDRFRGENMAVFSAEYRWPFTKTITGVGFMDVGDAWGGDFPTTVPGFVIPAEHDSFSPKFGVGLGVRLNVQPFGTLALDFGRGDEGSEVHLNFGQTF